MAACLRRRRCPRWSRTAARASRTPSTPSAPTSRRSTPGAEGLECDVRLTADGHLVCVHDRDLRRTARPAARCRRSNLEDLEALDFASWKSPWADLDDEAPDRDESLDRVLTLRKLLETVADYDRRVEVAIETKHPTRYGGLVEKRLSRDAARLRLGRPKPRAEPGPGDELQLHGAAADATAGAARAAGEADRQGDHLAGPAPDHGPGLDGRPGHRAARARTPAGRADRRARPRRPRLDGQHRGGPAALPGARGARRSSPTGRRTMLELLGK